MEKYIPKNANAAKVKYLAIAAHQDDVEIMAMDGIAKGQADDASFVAVVLTDGAGCPKNAKYAKMSPEKIKALRVKEQKAASEIGRYHALYLAGYPSSDVKAQEQKIVDEIKEVLLEYSPLEAVYIHNPADKHPTHFGASMLALKAVLSLPIEKRPNKLFGCEVWRSLDWLSDDEKVAFNLEKSSKLADKLLKVYKSQNASKSYDEGARGRRLGNATFGEAHENNAASEVWFAMDLTLLLQKNAPTVKAFVADLLNKFENDVLTKF